MSIKAEMKNEATGDSRTVKAGWSWTCFFFGPFLGIPYFMRKLPVYGVIGVVVWIAAVAAASLVLRDPYSFVPALASNITQVACLVFGIFGGLRANKITFENYKKLGYVIKGDGASPNVIAVKENRYSKGELALAAVVILLWAVPIVISAIQTTLMYAYNRMYWESLGSIVDSVPESNTAPKAAASIASDQGYVPCSGSVIFGGMESPDEVKWTDIHSAPTDRSAVSLALPPFTRVRVDGWAPDSNEGDRRLWFRVTDAGGYVLGWVHSGVINKEMSKVDFGNTPTRPGVFEKYAKYDPSPARKNDPAKYDAKPASGYIKVVKSDRASGLNLRPAPGYVDDIVAALSIGTTVKVDGWSQNAFDSSDDGKWLRLIDEHGNVIGWVTSAVDICDDSNVAYDGKPAAGGASQAKLDIAGRYTYAAEGQDATEGLMTIMPDGKDYAIEINVSNRYSGKTGWYEGKGQIVGGKLISKMEYAEEDAYVRITFKGDDAIVEVDDYEGSEFDFPESIDGVYQKQ